MDDIELARKQAILRLQKRAEMRSAHEIEDSTVIDQHAATATQIPSQSPNGPLGWVVSPIYGLVKLVPENQRLWPVMLALGIIAGALIGYACHKIGVL